MVNNQGLLVEKECILKKDAFLNIEKNKDFKVPTTVFRRTKSKLTIWKELGLPNFCQEVVIGLYHKGSKTWEDYTSPSSRFKKVKHLHQQPIIQDGRNQESTIDGQTRLLHGKTRDQESLPPRISRSTIQSYYSASCGKDHITV
ncbi:hypothetical protein ACTFIW_008756 [Dictyostelium discoideum]